MQKFRDYIIQAGEYAGGGNIVFRFDNGYGASVANNFFSCGIEVAVIEFDNNDDWKITYNTPITNDVIRGVKTAELLELLEDIKNLKLKEE